MQKEQLVCESCNLSWTRPKSRGRKPKLCKSCIPTLVLQEPEEDINVDQINLDLLSSEPPLQPTTYKAGTKWLCSSCLVSIKIGVGHNEPPTHACKKKLKKIIPLQKV
jgi:hypothetical protein